MDLDFTEEQEVLREMVRGLCNAVCPIDVVRKMEDDPKGYTDELWKQLSELGLCGLLVPEAYGGTDQSLLDAAIVYEELGRALVPSPHFVSAVLGARVLAETGSTAQRETWLPRIANGEAIFSVAWNEPDNGWEALGVQLRAERDGSDYIVTGVKRHVGFASSATRLVLLVRTGDGPRDLSLLLVDPQAPGITLAQQRSLASDTQYEVRFDGARIPATERLGALNEGWSAWERVMHDAIVLLAAQANGGAERALEITVQYAKDRKQFDKPLGAFQAISHYLADASTAIDGSRTLAYEAAWARSAGRPHEKLAAMAKLFATGTYRDVTAMAQQVWGGVGFTIEYDIQLFFRRAKQLQITWWDAATLEERIAGHILD